MAYYHPSDVLSIWLNGDFMDMAPPYNKLDHSDKDGIYNRFQTNHIGSNGIYRI